MVSLQGMAVALVGVVAVIGCGVVVYRDAARAGVSRPPLWASVVIVAWGSALGLFFAPLAVPIPGLLVLVVGGPALYLFERDDATHGDEPADPFSLPDGSDSDSSSEGRRDD